MKKIDIVKWKYIGLIGCIGMFLLTACNDDDDTEQAIVNSTESKLEVLNEESTFSFSSAGNVAQKLLFNATRDWHIEVPDDVDVSWLTVFEREGKAGEGNRVWVAVAENTDVNSRRASFRLVSGGYDYTFVVFQAQKDAVVITDPKSYENMTSEERIIPIEFGINKGDYDYKITAADGAIQWIEATDERPVSLEKENRAMEQYVLYFKVKPNEKFDVRRGTIEIFAKDDNTVKASLNVIQYGLPKPVLTVENANVFENLGAAKDSILLKFTATNVKKLKELTVAIDKSDRDWISFVAVADENALDSTYMIKLKENTGGERRGTVALCSSVDSKVKAEFTITQQQASDVELVINNKADFREDVLNSGTGINVKYSTRSAMIDPKNELVVEIEYPENSGYTEKNGWLKLANKSMAERVIFTCDTNKILKARQATVRIYRKGYESKKDYLIIRQAAATLLEIPTGKSLQEVLNGLVEDGIYTNLASITRLELKGKLSDSDFTLLSTMTKAGKGYTLKRLDLTACSNKTMKNAQFVDCTLLEYIALPIGLEAVPRELCRRCTNLTTVVVNEGPNIIGRHAFGNTKMKEVWLPSTLEYMYGYVFDNVDMTTFKVLHLKSLPFQWRNVARSDASEGASQETSWSTLFKGDVLPKTIYVPADYVELYKNPDPQHVVSYPLKDLLKDMKDDDEIWVNGPKANSPYLRSGTPVKRNFTWSSSATSILAEPEN